MKIFGFFYIYFHSGGESSVWWIFLSITFYNSCIIVCLTKVLVLYIYFHIIYFLVEKDFISPYLHAGILHFWAPILCFASASLISLVWVPQFIFDFNFLLFSLIYYFKTSVSLAITLCRLSEVKYYQTGSLVLYIWICYYGQAEVIC